MSTGRNASPPSAIGDIGLPAPLHAQLRGGSAPMDWLAPMILAVRTVAAGAEFISLPYIRAAFGTVVIFLETVDRMKRNRDDLRELCEGTVEIVLLLRDEISAHGHAIGARFMGLCENFMSFLHLVQTGLENLMQNRAGLRGRFKEFLRATSVADQIDRYRIRVNELRSNFILATTIQTSLNVATIQRSVSASQEIAPIAHQFRRVALGDMNLLYETALSSKVHKIKVFTARISGESSLMTVVKYEDNNERWTVELQQHSSWRHPHVSQLFGISSMPGIHALIYYDEMVPLWIYRKVHRSSSDLVWSCVEGMLFKQFKECSDYHYWFMGDNEKGLQAAICVKTAPVRLCLAMPGLGNDPEVRDLEYRLSAWHSEDFERQRPAPETFSTVANILTASSDPTLKTLASHMDWTHCLAALLPRRFYGWVPYDQQTKLFLGSVVTSESGELVPVAYIPNSSRIRSQGQWVLQRYPNGLLTPEGDGLRKRFSFPPGSFKATEMSENSKECPCLEFSVELEGVDENLVSTSWLSQANLCISGTIFKDRIKYQYATIDMLRCLIVVDTSIRHQLRPEGTLREAHLFPCRMGVRNQGGRIGLEFPHADHWYWSLDPSGVTRMTVDESNSIGLPQWKFYFLQTINSWREYHYNAIREFSETRGFDPYSNDVARLLGLPLAEMEPHILTNLPQADNSHL